MTQPAYPIRPRRLILQQTPSSPPKDDSLPQYIASMGFQLLFHLPRFRLDCSFTRAPSSRNFHQPRQPQSTLSITSTHKFASCTSQRPSSSPSQLPQVSMPRMPKRLPLRAAFPQVPPTAASQRSISRHFVSDLAHQ
jgi:hypothetical protein